MIKDNEKARSAFTAARAEREKIVQAQPNYGPALCVLGLIDAGLGRKDDALREGERAVELLPVEKDAMDGSAMIKYLAIIAAWVESPSGKGPAARVECHTKAEWRATCARSDSN